MAVGGNILLWKRSNIPSTRDCDLTMTQVAVMIVALLGSLVFQMQKNSSNVLYFHGNSWSCTTRQEWTWIAVTGLLMLLLQMKPHHQIDPPSEQAKSKLFLCFLAINLLWFSAAISELDYTSSVVKAVEFLGAKAAWPGMWNFAFVIFPVKRSSEVFAISHKDTLFLHIWAGQAIFFWLAVHTVFLSIAYVVNSDYSIRNWTKVMVPSDGLYTEGVVNFMGWLGLAMFLLLWLTSRTWIRKHCYEIFSFLHLATAASFILFSNLHDYNTIHFVQPAFAAWIAERLVRRISTVNVMIDQTRPLTSAHDGILGNGGILAVSMCERSGRKGFPPLVCLTMTLPRTWNVCPGTAAFLYLKCPSISNWQLHPFSISTIDVESMTFSVHIKALGDWTNQFIRQINQLVIEADLPFDAQQTGRQETSETSQDTLTQFGLRIEGPYYSDLGGHLDSDQKCLFIAGGVGLTGFSEVLYRRHRRGQATLLVWILRTVEEMDFLAKDLLDRLHPPRDSFRVMVFITRQDEHYERRRRQTTKVDRAPLLVPGCVKSTDRHDAAAKSLLTFTTTVEETSSNPSLRTMSLVSFLGVALSFFLARMTCCNRTVRDIETGRTLHTCSAGPRASTSMTCSNSCQDENGGIPCCTTSICFYCFRGLPVLFMFFLAPLLPLLFAWVYPYCIHVTKWVRKSIRPHRVASEFRSCTLIPLHMAGQSACAVDDTTENSVTYGDETNHSMRVIDDLCHRRVPAVMANLNHTTVEYRKPKLSQIVQEFGASVCRNDDDDFAFSDGIPSNARRNAERKEAAVFVCGSKALAESVLKEVKIHNADDTCTEERSTSSQGAFRSKRRVYMSVWTATGAY